MKKGLITGNLVEEYMLGATKIRIYDSAYEGKTQEDIDRTMARIADIARNAKRKKGEKGQELDVLVYAISDKIKKQHKFNTKEVRQGVQHKNNRIT